MHLLAGSCKKSADMICERGNVAKSLPAQSNVRPCENGSAHGWRCCGNCMLDAWSSVVCPGQESRRSACQLLRKKLAEQKIDCGPGFFDVPFPDGTIARLPSMPMKFRIAALSYQKHSYPGLVSLQLRLLPVAHGWRRCVIEFRVLCCSP